MNVTSSFRSRVAAYHAWRLDQPLVTRLLLVVGWAGLMGLLAQVRIPLPFTPVPFTMQVFGVLLGAVLLGTRDGTLAQAAYVGAGVAGVPWFQGLNGGAAYFFGATGGYLLAAPFAALVVGALVNRAHVRSIPGLVGAMLAGLAVIYALGVAWLSVALEFSLAKAFLLGAAPFIAADLAKAVAAAALARPLLPSKP